MEKWVVGKVVGNWDQRENVENGKDDRMCEKCYTARRGNIEIIEYFDILHGVAQGCTLSPTLFKVFISYMIRVVQAAKLGVKVGEDTVSG